MDNRRALRMALGCGQCHTAACHGPVVGCVTPEPNVAASRRNGFAATAPAVYAVVGGDGSVPATPERKAEWNAIKVTLAVAGTLGLLHLLTKDGRRR